VLDGIETIVIKSLSPKKVYPVSGRSFADGLPREIAAGGRGEVLGEGRGGDQ